VVAGRFPLFPGIDIDGPLIKRLVRKGWDTVRAVDVLPGDTVDDVLFEYAVEKKAHNEQLRQEDREMVLAQREDEERMIATYEEWEDFQEPDDGDDNPHDDSDLEEIPF
jgi:hypothetical protein